MATETYRFEFRIPNMLSDAELTLHLAQYAIEGLYGEARVRLESSYRLDRARGAVLIEGGNEVGLAVVKAYTRLLAREFGEDAFEVRRLETPRTSAPEDVTCPAR